MEASAAPLTEFRLQPLGKLSEIDDHPLVRPDPDHLGSVCRLDCELDAPAVDLGDLGLARDAPSGRSGCHVANVDACAECALARAEVRLYGVERCILHGHDHHRCRQDWRQHRVLEAVGEVFGSDDETERALGPGRNRLHWSFSALRYISWFAAYPLEHLQAIIAVVPGKRWVIVLPHSTEGYGQTDELYRR